MVASKGPEPEVKGEGAACGLISKRLRAVKKKLQKVQAIESTVSEGKDINDQQAEVLASKALLVAMEDELEKIKALIAEAVEEDIAAGQKPVEAKSSRKETRTQAPKEVVRQVEVVKEVEVVREVPASPELVEAAVTERVREVMKVLYFAQLFDVHTGMSNWQSQMERSACLSYDYGHSLEPKDLDAICVFGKMVTTRAGGMTISHKDALDLCVRHAMSIYTGGETPLLPETDLTYNKVKSSADRIESLEYFTTTPVVQPVNEHTARQAAAAAAAAHHAMAHSAPPPASEAGGMPPMGFPPPHGHHLPGYNGGPPPPFTDGPVPPTAHRPAPFPHANGGPAPPADADAPPPANPLPDTLPGAAEGFNFMGGSSLEVDAPPQFPADPFDSMGPGPANGDSNGYQPYPGAHHAPAHFQGEGVRGHFGDGFAAPVEEHVPVEAPSEEGGGERAGKGPGRGGRERVPRGRGGGRGGRGRGPAGVAGVEANGAARPFDAAAHQLPRGPEREGGRGRGGGRGEGAGGRGRGGEGRGRGGEHAHGEGKGQRGPSGRGGRGRQPRAESG